MELPDLFVRLGVALGLGLLVGLQRERVGAAIGGLRTFTLVTVFGTVCGLLAEPYGGWVVASGLAATAAVVVISNFLGSGEEKPGMTTEVSMLLMFAVGAYLATGYVAAAVAIGGGTAVLLQFKAQLHGVARRLSDGDVTAMMRFALLALVILPVLPNRTYGPFDVLNPRQIWLMIVLIVGISFAGYVAYKFFGERVGTFASGILGGLISSTATTVSYARRAAGEPGSAVPAATVIALASTVVYARVLIEIGAVAPGLLPAAAAPFAIQALTLAAVALAIWLRNRSDAAPLAEQENPTQLRGAIVFGLLYAVVLVVAAAARERFGTAGLYVVAAVSGLTDVDAITLSTSKLVAEGRVAGGEGWRIVTVAVVSNLAFKAGIVGALGSRALFAMVAASFGAAIAVGLLLAVVWPDGGLVIGP